MSTDGGQADLGPTEWMLCVSVARMHYLEDLPKTEIASALGISRFKVARLIKAAREHNIVRIEIAEKGSIDAPLSAGLQAHLGVRTVVASTIDIAQVTADLLPELLADGDVLGLPWSRSVARMVGLLHDLPHVDIVQLTGAHQAPGVDTSAVAITRRAARVSGGEPTLFFAPFLTEDAEAAQVFRRQPELRRAQNALQRVTHAVVAAGAWAKGSSTVFDAVSPALRRQAAEAGAVGEIAGILLDMHGQPVETEISDRLITVDHRALQRIPHVLLQAEGAAKAHIVRAAIAGGLIDELVCDRPLANALLGTG